MSLPMADKGPVSGVSRPILTVPSAMAFVAPPAITPATSTVSRTPTHALVLIVPSLVIPSFDLSSGGPVASHDVAAQIGRGVRTTRGRHSLPALRHLHYSTAGRTVGE